MSKLEIKDRRELVFDILTRVSEGGISKIICAKEIMELIDHSVTIAVEEEMRRIVEIIKNNIMDKEGVKLSQKIGLDTNAYLSGIINVITNSSNISTEEKIKLQSLKLLISKEKK